MTRVRPKALQSAGSAKSQLFDGLDDDEPSLANGVFMPKFVSLVRVCWREEVGQEFANEIKQTPVEFLSSRAVWDLVPI